MIRRIERQGAMHDATDGVNTRTVVEKGTDNLMFGVEPGVSVGLGVGCEVSELI